MTTIFTVVILIGLAYGFMRFMFGLTKELAEFFIEAWRDIEIEP